MSEADQMLASLLARVEALEWENNRLRQRVDIGEQGERRAMPRREMLAGGVGLFGAMVGGEILAQGQAAHAGSLDATRQSVVTAAQFSQPRISAARVRLRAVRSSSVVWARYAWSLDPHFTGAEPPIVVASIVDSAADTRPDAAAVCSVFTYGKPGAYAATVTVHNLHPDVDHVDVNVMAFGG